MSRYLPLITFVIITLLVFMLSFILDEKSWQIVAYLDTAFAISLGILAFFGYYEYVKSEDKIDIFLEVDGVKKETGLSLLRKNCTRSEVFGILGMIQNDNTTRFDIAYMKNRDLLSKLQAVQKGGEKELLIPISSDEFSQFDQTIAKI